MAAEHVFSVSDFVAVFNQSIDYAFPSVMVEGELANFRVSKNKWVYFDLKDEMSSVKFFGTVYQLPGPLEDGLMLQVRGVPRLHNQFGFSVNVQNVQLVGEGSLKKAAALLEAKLAAEGLFDESRKRLLPYPPQRIGLIASSESAAYHDFIKILSARWAGLDVSLYDTQVQGEAAPGQITAAIEYFNTHAEPVDVLVITRGGGSAEDLAAFSTEQVTRAVAASRIPTLVAIGHEIDISLAELAADRRASTPSNAAELLVPDKDAEIRLLADMAQQLSRLLSTQLTDKKVLLKDNRRQLEEAINKVLLGAQNSLDNANKLLEALSPQAALRRGYAVVTAGRRVVRSVAEVTPGQVVAIKVSDGIIDAEVKGVQ